ncbi:MAG TPA: hypothetical protein VHX66_06955 [Solirubrobacteraceae bacterium]|jgi:hypothetical protein|nr:hypothetical protein [Solirubrobacteraceae bacterium]
MHNGSCTAQPGLASQRAVRRSARCAANGMLSLGVQPRHAHGRRRRVNAAIDARPATLRSGYRAAYCT